MDMELDTGVSLTLINKASCDKITNNNPATLEHTDVQLQTYTGQSVQIRYNFGHYHCHSQIW